MPNTGGMLTTLWHKTAVAIVNINNATILLAPRLISNFSLRSTTDFSLEMKKLIIIAGTKKLTKDGINKTINCSNFTKPDCQIINVVISPKGLNTPPALAATTMLIQAMLMNFLSLDATFNIIAHISIAVVKLLAKEEIAKAKIPVNQNKDLKLKPLDTIHKRKPSKIPLSSIALM